MPGAIAAIVLPVYAALRETLAWLSRDPRVRYAEVRFTDETVESVRVRATRSEGRRDSVVSSRSRGVGIRVLGDPFHERKQIVRRFRSTKHGSCVMQSARMTMHLQPTVTIDFSGVLCAESVRSLSTMSREQLEAFLESTARASATAFVLRPRTKPEKPRGGKRRWQWR